jgi:D-alanyl-D-alanine carboxypeptidase
MLSGKARESYLPIILWPVILSVLLPGASAYAASPVDRTMPEVIGVIAQSPTDPLGPYVREAAQRFQVPELWVRAVILQESGGWITALSPAGAMGPMQVIRATYERLRRDYGLGSDPYDPRNNILAGTAFIREMFERFGFPGFLAAYNAGPQRMDGFMSGLTALPSETVRYVAMIAPRLSDTVAPSGPLSVFVPGWAERQKLPVVITPNSIPLGGMGPQVVRMPRGAD